MWVICGVSPLILIIQYNSLVLWKLCCIIPSPTKSSPYFSIAHQSIIAEACGNVLHSAPVDRYYLQSAGWLPSHHFQTVQSSPVQVHIPFTVEIDTPTNTHSNCQLYKLMSWLYCIMKFEISNLSVILRSIHLSLNSYYRIAGLSRNVKKSYVETICYLCLSMIHLYLLITYYRIIVYHNTSIIFGNLSFLLCLPKIVLSSYSL